MNDLNNNNEMRINNTISVQSQTDKTIIDNNSIDYGSAMPPVGTPNNNDEKKKVIIVIGIVIILILIIVLIVISNKDDSSNKLDNEDNKTLEKEDTSYKDEYLDEKNRVYFYRLTIDDTVSYVASNFEYKDSERSKYEELYSYECKGKCVYSVSNPYDKAKNKLIIRDDEEIYSYDNVSNKLSEVSFDKKIESDDVTFEISDEFIACYDNKNIEVTTNEVNFQIFETTEINGIRTSVSKTVIATRETLKDNVYVVSSNIDDYTVHKIYVSSHKISETKVDHMNNVQEINFDGKYVILKCAYTNLIVSKSGKVQEVAREDRYSYYNEKLVVATSSGKVVVYDDNDKIVSTIDALYSTSFGKGYALVIRDDKLLLFDALSSTILHDFGSVSSTERLANYRYPEAVRYSTFGSTEHIDIFLEDTSKPREGDKIFGRSIRYDLTTGSINITEDDNRTIIE